MTDLESKVTLKLDYATSEIIAVSLWKLCFLIGGLDALKHRYTLIQENIFFWVLSVAH